MSDGSDAQSSSRSASDAQPDRRRAPESVEPAAKKKGESGRKPRWPVAGWIPSYRPSWLPFDLLAGLTLAAYAIPVSLAYSSLAGLPAASGLYCYLVGGVVFALLGTSRAVAFGPTSSIAILIGSTLGGLAAGDAQKVVDLGAMTAVLVAAIAIIGWALRFGHVASFISDTVLTGFKAGAAVVIASTQLPKLLGIDAKHTELFPLLVELAGRTAEINPYSVWIGLGAILLLGLGQLLLPARPVALLVVVGAILASHFFEFGAHGVKTVGSLSVGLPALSLPTFGIGELRLLTPLALGCFLLAFVEHVTAARTFAEQDREPLDANRELLALGGANLASGLVHGFPAAGGMSQSAVNAKAGARSPLSLVFASVAIGIVLLFFTHLLSDLPSAILAAVVFMAVKDMIKVGELLHLRRVNKIEFSVAMVSLLVVLAFGILEGLLLATIFSIVMLLRWAANPHTAVLGRIPGTDRFGDVERHPGNETFPGLLIFRAEGSLFYFNVDSVKQQLLDRVDEHDGDLELVIFDLSSSPQIDLAGVRMLGELCARLKERGVAMQIAEPHHAVRELLRAENMEEHFGKITRKATCATLQEDFCTERGSTPASESDATRALRSS